MYELVAAVTLLMSGYLIARILGAEGKAEFLLIFFCVATAEIALCGYALSAFDQIGDVRGWSVLGTASFLAAAAAVTAKRGIRTAVLSPVRLGTLRLSVLSVLKWYKEETSTFEKFLLTPMIVVVVSIAALNLTILVQAAPHNYDSMTYRLARMAYYLQQGNLNYYPANFWAQVVMAKNSALLLIYSYLMSFRNENMTQLVQYISYWVAVCSVYGIARKTGSSRTHSVFAALVSALLVGWLLESITTQNDMLVAAYTGAVIYFLFAFRETGQRKYLALAALGIGLSFGASAKSFFPLPSVLIVAGYVLMSVDTLRERLRSLGYLAASVIFAASLFSLPAGYVDNLQNFGNPIGPEEITRYSFEGKPLAHVMENGAKNVLRFGFEFLSFDGLLPFDVVYEAQKMITAAPKSLMSSLGVDLESPEWVIKPFRYLKPRFASEDWHTWGVFGFALIWVVVLLSAIGVIKSRDVKILSYASIACIFTVAFAGYYEPHLVRYFVACAVFAAPTAAVALKYDNRAIRSYVLLVVVVGCLSALSAVILRGNRPPFSIAYEDINLRSVFAMDRVGQLTTSNRGLYRAIKNFDRLVPEDATVAVFLYEDTFEYPLFGEDLSRTIIPINPFVGGFRAIPAGADFLLYAAGFPDASRHDLHLGADWYLRKLDQS